MHYVVTGGCGFIGSNIVAQLEGSGHGPISIIDDLGSDDRWQNVSKRSLRDIIPSRLEMAYLKAQPREGVALIHMGARSSTTDTDAGDLADINARLTADLFDLCTEKQWPFIWASSASVYGEKADGEVDFDDGINLSSLRPLNAYAWSKLAAEKMIVQRAHTAKDIAKPPLWAGLRLFNVYGPCEGHKGGQKSFVTRCFETIRASKPIELFRGSDQITRDWVAVEDVARLVVDILTDRAVPITSGIFNVGTGHPVSFVDVARLCIEVANKTVPITTIPFPDELRGRYQYRTRADTTKLMKAFPYFKFADLHHGASHYWQGWASRDSSARYP